MTAESLKEFEFVGDANSSNYWQDIFTVRRQGYDPKDDGMITVPFEQLKELQQCYVQTLNALYDIADVETGVDKARECLKGLNN